MLVVDDEALIVDILRIHLERAGHSVVTTGNGLAAFDIWSAGEFDVVISDIRLPGTSGVELLRRIRAVGGALPFVLISGHVHDAEIGDDADLQPWSILAKPFSFSDVEAAIGRVAGGQTKMT